MPWTYQESWLLGLVRTWTDSRTRSIPTRSPLFHRIRTPPSISFSFLKEKQQNTLIANISLAKVGLGFSLWLIYKAHYHRYLAMIAAMTRASSRHNGFMVVSSWPLYPFICAIAIMSSSRMKKCTATCRPAPLQGHVFRYFYVTFDDIGMRFH